MGPDLNTEGYNNSEQRLAGTRGHQVDYWLVDKQIKQCCYYYYSYGHFL